MGMTNVSKLFSKLSKYKGADTQLCALRKNSIGKKTLFTLIIDAILSHFSYPKIKENSLLAKWHVESRLFKATWYC